MTHTEGSPRGNIRRILVVDDLVEVAELLVEVLSARGFTVECRYDGQAGFDAVSTFLPDLVITDYRLPVFDGLQLLNRLKANNAFSPKVFLATADIGFESQIAYALGAEAVLLKPFNIETLFKHIDRFSLAIEDSWNELPGENQFEMHISTEINQDLGFFKSLAMGRGGLTLKAEFIPTLNDSIGFSIDIKDSPINRIEGSGRVRWITDDVEGIANIGLEFEYIHGSARNELIQLIRKYGMQLPYIPSSS